MQLTDDAARSVQTAAFRSEGLGFAGTPWYAFFAYPRGERRVT